MNANFNPTYLEGGDDYFGPNLGGATVYTNTTAGFTSKCPNIGRFLKNLKFSLQMENEIMGDILDKNMTPETAAKTALMKDDAVLSVWMAGVKTKDGRDGLAAVKSALGM